MSNAHNEELDSAPLEGDRPGPHPVDVEGELPLDGEQTHETQLMSDAELEPKQVEGDRFDVNDDDLGTAPDLEDDPDTAPDLRPDRVVRLAELAADGESAPAADEDDVESVTAPPLATIAEDEPVDPDEMD